MAPFCNKPSITIARLDAMSVTKLFVTKKTETKTISNKIITIKPTSSKYPLKLSFSVYMAIKIINKNINNAARSKIKNLPLKKL